MSRVKTFNKDERYKRLFVHVLRNLNVGSARGAPKLNAKTDAEVSYIWFQIHFMNSFNLDSEAHRNSGPCASRRTNLEL
jgi:hypothetical protein